MGNVKLIIDNEDVSVPEGSTILQAARMAGIYIPSLCDHPDLKPIGVCKLCIVKVEGSDLYPLACNTIVRDGMVVKTSTEEIQEMRRYALEMLLAMTNHPYSCLFCERKSDCSDLRECMRKMPQTVGCKYCQKNGECELQRAVEHVGLTKVRYPVSYRNLPLEREPFFDRDYNLCILCGRCVRTCSEVRGEGILFMNPDFHRSQHCGPDDLQSADCKFCGSCVDACPTGALTARFEKWLKPDSSKVTVCPYCGVGCQMEVGVKDESIVKVRGKRGSSPNNG